MDKSKISFIALCVCLLVYVGTLAGVWAALSIKAGYMWEIPNNLLYVGAVLVGAVTGVDVTDKFKKPPQR